MKFKTIYKRSAALDNVEKHRGYEGLANRVGYLVDAARVNADDTVYLEKTVDEDQFDKIAVASLEGLLCSCTDEEVCAWFRKQGFRW